MFEVKTLVKNQKDALNFIEALRDIELPLEISITFLEEVSNEELFECFLEFPFYDTEVQRALIKQYQIERMNQEEAFWIKMVRREKERRIQEILKSNL